MCELKSLANPGSQGFTLKYNEGIKEIFVVRCGEAVYAYQNECPHTGVNLEWLKDQFLDLSNSYIQCATHGALFRLEDGYCLRGPCAGEYLTSVKVKLEAGQVVVFLNN
ncbi:MAG: Rieske 2Fe-2S domain-containing protein [Candidatus Thiodiazotropha sp. (ex Codakia rugifera)]|nr:Rieske 2Fe-2S domain-containing protein [Candidatus Thiodiazotropha sp. (ex Codakia rugifera)]